MKEFNNRDIADKFAEYITGQELRKYLALEDDKEIFRMPKNNDDILNTQLFQNGKSKRTHYEMIGKTK